LNHPIIGIFYEVTPVDQKVTWDLFIELCQAAARHIPNPPGNIGGGDVETLRKVMLEFARVKFSSAYGFEWNGATPQVPDSGAEDEKLTYNVLFNIAGYPPTTEDIGKDVGLYAFGRDGHGDFPSDEVQATLFDQLVKKIHQAATHRTTSTQTNMWHAIAQRSSVRITNSDPRSGRVKQYTILVYTLGTKSAQGVNVKSFFLQYLTVFASIPGQGAQGAPASIASADKTGEAAEDASEGDDELWFV